MHKCNYAVVWKIADSFPEMSESDLNMKTNLVIEKRNNYWTRLSKNIVISHCFAVQLFALAEWFTCSPLKSHITFKLIQ